MFMEKFEEKFVEKKKTFFIKNFTELCQFYCNLVL